MFENWCSFHPGVFGSSAVLYRSLHLLPICHRKEDKHVGHFGFFSHVFCSVFPQNLHYCFYVETLSFMQLQNVSAVAVDNCDIFFSWLNYITIILQEIVKFSEKR